MKSIHRSFLSLILLGCSLPAFGQTPTPTLHPDLYLLDHNQDEVVDSLDLLFFLQGWKERGIVPPSPTVPPSLSVNILSIPMVRIPAGSFMMGSPDTERGRDPDEGPLHQVTFENDFYLGETEVTQRQWCAVMGADSRAGSAARADYPIQGLSWIDCHTFIANLNALTDRTFRLPSEAEWEYACRAGRTTRFYFGNSLGCGDGCQDCDIGKGLIVVEKRSDFMWYCASNDDGAHPVAQLIKNRFGLYDMAGNVSEWCQDTRHSDYTGAPTDGSAWEAGGLAEIRVFRGGKWSSSALVCRSAFRDAGEQSTGSTGVGLRLAMDP